MLIEIVADMIFHNIISTLRVIKHSMLNSSSQFSILSKIEIDDKRILHIYGNGNSLKNADFKTRQKNVDNMVVNRHILSSTYQELKPEFYTIIDPHFFQDGEGYEILKLIFKKTSWPMMLIIPNNRKFYKPVYHLAKLNSLITVVNLNTVPIKGSRWFRHLFYKNGWSMPRTQNVMVAAIYCGIESGYNNLKIFGVEHSWLKNLTVNTFNEVCLKNPHFYDKDKVEVKTWKQIQGEPAKLHEVLRAYANMFESYNELREYANHRKCKILNCTKDSYIDAFERIIN